MLLDEVSEGQRGPTAGRCERGGVDIHPRDRGVVLRHAGVGREVLDHGVADQASGVDGRGRQLTDPLILGDVLVADVAAGFLANDVGDLLVGEPLIAPRVDNWAPGVSARFEQGDREQVGGVRGANLWRAAVAEAVGEHAGLSDRARVRQQHVLVEERADS